MDPQEAKSREFKAACVSYCDVLDPFGWMNRFYQTVAQGIDLASYEHEH